MTRPKLRPCPTCQTLNKASIKTCTVCYGTLSTKMKIIKKAATLDSKWGQGVVRNRNVNRIIDSARIAVLKLEARGFKPILFYGHRDKKSPNKWVADVMTHFAASSVTKAILDKMRRVYEVLLTQAEQSQTAQQPQSASAEHPEQPLSASAEQPLSASAEQPQSASAEQPQSAGAEQPQSAGAEQPQSAGAEQPQSSSAEQPEFFVLNLMTCPTSPSSSPSSASTNMPSPQTSSLKKEGPQKRKKKTVGNLQKVFLFDKVLGRRMNEGKAECEICWLPCSVWTLCAFHSNRTWDNTWEPACNFECLTATPESPGPSGSA